MSLTYATFTATLANFLVIPIGDANLAQALPSIIDEAEQMSYRDLDLLNTVIRNSTVALSTLSRNFTEPLTSSNPFVVTQQMNVITPAGAGPDSSTSVRVPLLPASKEMLDALYPSAVGAGVPQYFAPITQNLFIVGPWPDGPYVIEVVGTQRPVPLSVSNAETILTRYLPDVFLNAALMIGYGYLKNFGAMADDPKSGLSWQAMYDRSLKSASIEEARKKFQAQGWSAFSTGPEASPART